MIRGGNALIHRCASRFFQNGFLLLTLIRKTWCCNCWRKAKTCKIEMNNKNIEIVDFHNDARLMSPALQNHELDTTRSYLLYFNAK